MAPDDDIVVLISDAQSPHDFQPRPSVVRRLSGSRALFLGDPTLDGWAAELTETEVFYLSAFLDVDEFMVVNGEKDPHFWTDPDVVRSLLPGLRQVLCTLRPEACATYVAREGRLARELAALAAELDNDLAPLSGRCVLSAQPFFQYFLHRFGIREAGTIEPVPGQEPPPAHVAATIERARADDCFGILAQRRLPDTSAKLVHRETGLPIIYLDPIGNADDVSYADYLRRNADILLKTALRSP